MEDFWDTLVAMAGPLWGDGSGAARGGGDSAGQGWSVMLNPDWAGRGSGQGWGNGMGDGMGAGAGIMVGLSDGTCYDLCASHG